MVGITLVNKQRVRGNFGKSAATYDEYADVQREMAADLMAHVKRLGRRFDTILEIGCGTGLLTGLLANAFPHARITALDIAPEMINIARQNLISYETITYVVADGEDPPLDTSFDLIISNATFQWFSEYDEPLKRYYQLLGPEGHLIFNTLGERTLEELRFCLSTLIGEDGTLQAPINLFSKGAILRALDTAGFIDVKVNESIKKAYYTSARHFILALKNTGTHSFSDRYLLPGGIGREVFRLISLYDDYFSTGRQVPASYHCLLGHAKRAQG